MRKCISCGTVSESNTAFICNKCGGRIVEVRSEGSSNCKNCGSPVSRDAAFCENCGFKLELMYNTVKKPVLKEKNPGENRIATILIAVLLLFCIMLTVLITVYIKRIVTEKTVAAATHVDSVQQTNSSKSDYGNTDNTNNVDNPALSELRDYDKYSDDWYRLRKSKWDSVTQAGAYKTVKKALEDAEIYVPQGYILYDKDFNVIIK